MERGLFVGLISGLAFSVVGVSAISLLMPLPQSPDAIVSAPDAGKTDQDGNNNGVKPDGKDADLVERAPIAPDGGAAAPGNLSSLEGADTKPAALPEVGGATGVLDKPTSETSAPQVDTTAAAAPLSDRPEAPQTDAGATDTLTELDEANVRPGVQPQVSGTAQGLSDPSEGGQAPAVTAGSDTLQAPTGPTLAPNAPSAEIELSISTVPAQPSAPDVTEADSGFGNQIPETETAPQVTTTEDVAPTTTDTTAVAQPTVDAATPAPTQPSAPAVDEEDAPRLAALPQTGTGAAGDGPAIGTRVTPLTERGNGNTIVTANAPVAAVVSLSTDPNPPLVRFAAPFENPDEKPLMAIVLIDDEKSFGSEALLDFPYVLTFAVNPAAPDAAEKMARYRAAGFEVITLIDLPVAGTAQDAEVSLSAGFDRVPETVAILEGVGSGFQGNRALSDQVTAIAAGTGRGLITQDKGLNTVQKLAQRSGVPSATVFRDFDGAGQTPAVMRRFLDQAAFRAGQEGAVVMLGRVRPDTISALLLWGLQDRAARVVLAPVSAVLNASVQ